MNFESISLVFNCGSSFLIRYNLFQTFVGLLAKGVDGSTSYLNSSETTIDNESDFLIDFGFHNKSKVDYLNASYGSTNRLDGHSVEWNRKPSNTRETNLVLYAISN